MSSTTSARAPAGQRAIVHDASLRLCRARPKTKPALDAAKKLGILKLPVQLVPLGETLLLDTMRTITKIVREERERFDEVIINAASGDKMQACATLSAAFVNGVRAIGVENNACFALPVLKFSYSELISEPKRNILRVLDKKGGKVDSLDELADDGGVDKSLLSYHIRGGRGRVRELRRSAERNPFDARHYRRAVMRSNLRAPRADAWTHDTTPPSAHRQGSNAP